MTSCIVPHVYDLLIICDKKGCKANAIIRIKASTYRERESAKCRAEASLEAEGWTFWVGIHPANREYCPEHKPDPRSTMQQVQRNANVS